MMLLAGVALPILHLLLCLGLPAVRVCFHVLHCATYNALPAGGHLHLPAGTLAGVEDRHPAHHEMPGAC